MPYLADLHIHSPFSRATSKSSNLAGLAAWARVKGIHLVGTGDFTHPGWLAQLKEQLVEAEPGFFKLRDENVPPAIHGITPAPIPTRFTLTAEVSSIYKRHGKVRKVHNILYAPDFASVERINTVLAGIGNIEADGRPILGLDSRDLLEILLEQAPDGFLVPAHIWTPWFSLFGSKSGFDGIEECFGDLSDHIFALETGLSSDPAMNRLISALDRFTLISNSDCHSPAKLGREVNIFDAEFNFFAMRDALRKPGAGFAGTVEFFPEEGKYHCDGHRKCAVCLEPAESRRLADICPVCSRPLTVGVLHRVMEMADRTEPLYPENAPTVESLIPLAEVLGEIIGTGPASKGVMSQYGRLINLFGSEFALLRTTPVDEIGQKYSPVLAEAINRMRSGKVIRQPGYDGEFGVIKVFAEGELAELAGQTGLFGIPRKQRPNRQKTQPLPAPAPSAPKTSPPRAANPEQQAAIASDAQKILVAAGPGTGKTFTLVRRIARLLTDPPLAPETFAAITFTNRAAAEVRERLTNETGPRAEQVFVGTLHRFCLDWLRRDQPDLTVIGEEERELLVKRLFPAADSHARNAIIRAVADYLATPAADRQEPPAAETARYLAELAAIAAIDLDDVIPTMLAKLATDTTFRERLAVAVRFLFVDEFQDLNHDQYRLMLQLSEHTQIFAIGDPDQAIYGFRGADLNCFFDFAKQGDVTVLSLERNYRSTPAILNAATGVIGHNHRRGEVILRPQRQPAGAVAYYPAPTPQGEAEYIVQRIEELLGGVSNFSINSGRGGTGGSELSFADIAVLYRLSQQAAPLAEALNRRGIPLQLIGATPFYLRRELRPLSLLVRAAANGVVSEHLALLRTAGSIGAATIDRLEREIPLHHDFFAALPALALPAKIATAVQAVAGTIGRFRAGCDRDGITAALAAAIPELAVNPAAPECDRFMTLAGTFGRNLAAFADHLRQTGKASVYDPRAEAVSLMTLHAAKGLEFPAVFLVGLEEGILPCALPGKPCDIEEERRLLYVGITRAGEHLSLTSASRRTLFGKTTEQKISRFVGEIPQQLLRHETARKTKPRPSGRQMTLF